MGRTPPRWTRNGEFLVYVVPVGGAPPDVYAAQLRLLRAHAELPVASLTRPGAYAAELSPFRSFSWRGPGALRFRFLSTTERLENVDGEDVHACNRPVGVLGLCHCPATPDLRAAFDQFAQSVRHFPGMLVQKCFAFEPRFDRATVDECGGIPDLVMFPAHQDLDDGESTVSVHLKVVMDTLAVTILMSIESAVRSAMRQQQQQQQQSIAALALSMGSSEAAGVSSFLLDTNVEPSQAQVQHANSLPLIAVQPSGLSGSFSTVTSIGPSLSSSSLVNSNPSTVDARSRKRQIARQRKLFGDYSTMVNCVPDAIEHYLAAIDLLRDEERRSGGASGDVLWLAAAIEGYIYCLYLESNDRFAVEIVEKTSEAVALYSKAGTTELECSLIEKVGWYYVAVASQLALPSSSHSAAGVTATSGLDRLKESIWVKRLLWDAIDRGIALFPRLSIQRQVEFLVQASRMLEFLGHRRRMAFLLHDAVSLLITRCTGHSSSGLFSPEAVPQHQKDLQAALMLERITASRLGIGDNKTGSPSPNWEVTSMRRYISTKSSAPIISRSSDPDDVWLVVRFHVLRQLLATAKMLGDNMLVGRYSIQLLEMLSWCDSIASSSVSGKMHHSVDAQVSSVDSLQRPAASSRAPSSLPDGTGLYTKNSVYFTPPPSLETKTKRYFSLAGSPSSTMSSAAASLSSTIANTPRILATPRQQLSAAVNAISTKASPAFVSFSHNSHSHAFSANSSNASTPMSTGSGGSSGFATVSPAGSSDQLGNHSSRTISESESSGADVFPGNGSTPNPSVMKQHQQSLFDPSTVRSVWNLRSREEIVRIEKKLLMILETECGALRPNEQAKLTTFLRVEQLKTIFNVAAPLIPRERALEQFGSAASNAGSASVKSDFFYSPFETKQKLKLSAREDGSAIDGGCGIYERAFPQREKIELRLVLSNPLGVPVEVQQVNVWVVREDESASSSVGSTSDVECYPASAVLAPYETCKAIVLGVRPLCAGLYRIRGCFVRAMNIRTSFILPDAVQSSLRVVQELPLVSLSLAEFGTMANESATKVAQGRETNEAHVTMYSSETKHCELRVRNVGQCVIENFRVAVSIRKRGVIRATLVVTNTLGEGCLASEVLTSTIVETDRMVLQCIFNPKNALSLPIANGETVSIPFDVRLKQNVSDLNGASAADEEEQLEWSVVYGSLADSIANKQAYVRENKLAVDVVVLPSLAIASVGLLPSCLERAPDDSSTSSSRHTMDHHFGLILFQIVNPTETAFRLRFRRRGQESSQFSEVDMGRKSSKRVAIEVPRLLIPQQPKPSLSLLVNDLVELEWQTYFGTQGQLIIRDSMWPNSSSREDAYIELVQPPLSIQIEANANEVEVASGDNGVETSLGNGTPAIFRFIDAPHLSAMKRLMVNVKMLEATTFTIRVRHQPSDLSVTRGADVDIRVSCNGSSEDAIGHQVFASGMLKKHIEWREGENESDMSVQFIFLTEGIFVVTASGLTDHCAGVGSQYDVKYQVWSHNPLYVQVQA